MNITKLTDQFATCDQLQTADIDAVLTLGFHSLICARPDGEADDQTPFAKVRKAAQARGLQTRYIPVCPTGATQANHAAFAAAMAELPEPILGYCRSGQRAANLWQAQQDAEV